MTFSSSTRMLQLCAAHVKVCITEKNIHHQHQQQLHHITLHLGLSSTNIYYVCVSVDNTCPCGRVVKALRRHVQ